MIEEEPDEHLNQTIAVTLNDIMSKLTTASFDHAHICLKLYDDGQAGHAHTDLPAKAFAVDAVTNLRRSN